MAKLATGIRWAARAWSIPSIVALLLPYLVEGLYWLGATSIREVVGHACFLAVLVGLILAWRWEGLGGGLTVAGTAAFYVTWWSHGKSPRGPFLLLVAAPGFLFCLYWLLTCGVKGPPQRNSEEEYQRIRDLEEVENE
jgi:hypothetical protein